MSKDYYLLNDADERTGPYKLEQICSMWTAGTITFDTLHWSADMAEWKPLRLIANDIHAARTRPAAGSAKKAPVPLLTAKASVNSDWDEKPVEKEPLFNRSFLVNSFLLLLALAVMACFLIPTARNTVIQAVQNTYQTYFPAPPEDKPHPHPAVFATPAPAKVVVPIAPVAPPEPPQKYSLDEIKTAIQSNLIDGGVIQNGAACDWQKLEYTDDTDVRYELLAHLSGGETKFCTGTVTLNPKKHQIVINSRLSG